MAPLIRPWTQEELAWKIDNVYGFTSIRRSAKDVRDTKEASPRLQEHECRMMTRGYPVQPAFGPGFCNIDWRKFYSEHYSNWLEDVVGTHLSTILNTLMQVCWHCLWVVFAISWFLFILNWKNKQPWRCCQFLLFPFKDILILVTFKNFESFLWRTNFYALWIKNLSERFK